MTEARLGPGVYVSGKGALGELGRLVARFGARPVVLHGSAGLAAAQAQSGTVLAGSPRLHHHGPCTTEAIERVASAAASLGADVLVALGGGRVLDVGKAAAEEVGVRAVTVPTSAATCAAVTALSVTYTAAGAWLGGRPLAHAPDATLVDLTVISQAPSRLLGAGVLDALAKVEEVRLMLAGHADAWVASGAAMALCALLDDRIGEHVTAAFADEPSVDAVQALAEAALVLPGWIGGLAGEANKVAAAHAVHNGLTTLSGSKAARHGELVAYGMVVQRILLGRDPSPIVRTVRTCRAPAGLDALGCGRYLTDDASRDRVLHAVTSLPTFTQAFPDVAARALDGAIRSANALLIGEPGAA